MAVGTPSRSCLPIVICADDMFIPDRRCSSIGVGQEELYRYRGCRQSQRCLAIISWMLLQRPLLSLE